MSQAGIGYAIMVGIGLLSAIGDILLERWARRTGWEWLAGSYAVWAVSLLLFGLYLRYQPIAFTTAVLLCIVAHLAVDILYDVLANGLQFSRGEWLGTALVIGGIILIEANRRPATDVETSTVSIHNVETNSGRK